MSALLPDPASLAWLLVLVGMTAALYSAVGHGGGSGYLAAMALLGVAPFAMKPIALTLNIAVATLVTVRFYRAGYFRSDLFRPFALGSVPLAFIGGGLHVSDPVYKGLVGVALLFVAVRLFQNRRNTPATGTVKPAVASALGAGIGLVSGITGVGGGIFLSPLVIILGWADVRATAAVSAPFILVNSMAGLLGHASSAGAWSLEILPLAACALAGAWVGSSLGLRRLANPQLRAVLGGVLAFAGIKLIAIA